MRAPRRLAAAALASALLALLAACGGADDAPRPAATPTPPPAAEATSTPTPTAEATPTPPPTAEATPTPTAEPTSTPAPTAEPPRAVTIGLVGDLMFARDVATLMEEHGADYPFARVAPLFEGIDLLVGNLEGTFTDRGTRQDKVYAFRAPPALASGLREAGFGAVSLANNHALDFGAVGLADTRAALDAAGVAHFGAGASGDEASRALVLEAGGARVALLGFSAVASSAFAEGGRPGVARAEAEAVAAAVAEAAADADFVVVCLHFGREYDPRPTERQRALARAAADAGASIVAGAHAHVLQPRERRGGSLILYGLGNFVFDLDADDLATLGEGPFATAVAVVELREGEAPRAAFRPAYIDTAENRPRPATDAEAARVLEALRPLGGE